MKFLINLSNWYNSKTNRQRNVLRITAFILAAFPIFGWIIVAPWMVPLVLYLEFHLKTQDSK
jgi:hypothetical protein